MPWIPVRTRLNSHILSSCRRSYTTFKLSLHLTITYNIDYHCHFTSLCQPMPSISPFFHQVQVGGPLNWGKPMTAAGAKTVRGTRPKRLGIAVWFFFAPQNRKKSQKLVKSYEEIVINMTILRLFWGLLVQQATPTKLNIDKLESWNVMRTHHFGGDIKWVRDCTIPTSSQRLYWSIMFNMPIPIVRKCR